MICIYNNFHLMSVHYSVSGEHSYYIIMSMLALYIVILLIICTMSYLPISP